MTLERVSAVVGLLVVIGSIALTFGIQMERLSNMAEDVKELKQRVEQVMHALGQIEHSRWKERQ